MKKAFQGKWQEDGHNHNRPQTKPGCENSHPLAYPPEMTQGDNHQTTQQADQPTITSSYPT